MSLSMSGRFAAMFGLFAVLIAGLSGCTYRARGHVEMAPPPPPAPVEVRAQASSSVGSPEWGSVGATAGGGLIVTPPLLPGWRLDSNE